MTLSAAEIVALDRRHIWHPYTQAGLAGEPFPVIRAEGARLYGENGRSCLDMISSWWVNLHGHAHPVIAEAVNRQARILEQVIFADCTHEPAVRLASRLTALLPDDLDRVFFSDNGSTAVEVALKVALQFWDNVGHPERSRLIAFEGGYHGDTVGAMSVGATSGYFRAWQNLLFPVDFLSFPDIRGDGKCALDTREKACLAELDQLLARNPGQTAALILEPLVQGAAGMRMCRPQFLDALSERLKQDGALLILDEVMTGFGRSGSVFAFQQTAVVPDMICLSKGLTGGFLPMALSIVRQEIYEQFVSTDVSRAFLHGHSFTANPLGCAAALASLDLLLDPLCEKNRTTLAQVHSERLPMLAEHRYVTNPRQSGTIAAFTLESVEHVTPLRHYLLEHDILMRPLPGGTFYLLPPYCVTKDELVSVYDTIEAGLDCLNRPAALDASRQSRYGDGSALF